MRLWAGFPFLRGVILARVPFTKLAISVDDQLQRLIDRGLVVDDQNDARTYLQRIGYYRLSGYTLPFQKGGNDPDRHEFKPDANFDAVLDRYIFDRKLRLLLLDAIERIEVAVRAGLSNHIAERHGPHWYMDAAYFLPDFDHPKYIETLRNQIGYARPNSRSIFIAHYYETYNTPDMPPAWMVFEDVSFGPVSMTVKNVTKAELRELCSQFGVSHDVLTSWLHTISYVRNLCAHHARVWNRVLTIKPVIARRYRGVINDNSRIYSVLIVSQFLLGKIAPDNHWAERLKELLEEHPNVPHSAMGIPADWHEQAVWDLKA